MRRCWLLAAMVGCSGDPATDPGDDRVPPVVDDTDIDTDEPVDTTPEPSSYEVVINEVMPGNQSTIDAPGGAKSDWIELLNIGDAPVALSQLKLRNDEGLVWQGPGDVELAAGERILVWADEGTDPLSTGFTLDKDGDKLTLLDDQDLVVDYLDMDEVDSDVSWARIPDGSGEPTATAWPTPNEENDEVASPTLNVANETVFLPYVVHTIEFTFTPQAYNQISQPARPEVHVAMEIDGVTYPDIGLKLKGSASYQSMDGKPAFMVDLNNFVAGTKFRGLKAFKLHNGVVLDPTRNRDYLTYQLAREAGLMGSRVGWADVYCNGEYFGIYIFVEKPDDEFIEYRRPGQQDLGVMLEPNESSGGGWGGGDFGSGTVLDWNFEEGPVPADPLTIEALTEADRLIGSQASDAHVAELWNYMNKTQLLSYMAWETLVMHTDGYRAPNNWRVFVDGDTHLIELVPSGVEWTWDYDVEPWYFGGRAASWCISNNGCKREYAERVLELADLTESLDLHTQFVDQQAWLDPYIQSDPRYNGSWDTVPGARSSTSAHLQQNPNHARLAVYDMFPDLEP